MTTGLDTIANAGGRIAVLAMDQRGTLRRMLRAGGQPAQDQDLVDFKIDVVRALGPLVTGILLDADYGVGPVRDAGLLPPGTGLLISAEPPDRERWNGEERTVYVPERGPEWITSWGGTALKFLVSWRPDRVPGPDEPDLAAEALMAVQAVVADCRRAALPSVIEPLVAARPEESAADREALVVRSATAMAELDMDLLKLEWPGDAAACRAMTDALQGVPWTLLSAGVGIDDFVVRTETALANGASGFIAGRAIWGEAVTVAGEERRAFLDEVAVPRMRRLLALLDGHGRSWREVAA